jgi:hypothetical protein
LHLSESTRTYMIHLIEMHKLIACDRERTVVRTIPISKYKFIINRLLLAKFQEKILENSIEYDTVKNKHLFHREINENITLFVDFN